MSNTKQHITLTVRIVVGLSSAVSFACLIFAQSAHETGYMSYGDLGAPFVSPFLYCVEFAFVWSMIIIPIELSSSHSLHPGIHVAFDLLAWSSVLATAIVYFLFMEPYFSGDGYDCKSLVTWGCNGKEVAVVEQVAAAFALLSVVLHFGFFVLACRATDKLRKGASRSHKVNAGA